MKKIMDWFKPPMFPDNEEKTTQARLLNAIGLQFVAALILAAFFYIPFFGYSWLSILALFIVWLVSRYWFARGRLRLASAWTVMAAWVIFFRMVWISGGAMGSVVIYIAATIVAASLLLGATIGNLLALASLLIGLVIAILHAWGYTFPVVLTFSPLREWGVFAFGVGFIVSMMNLVMHNQKEMLNFARQENVARRQAEAALRASADRYRSITERMSDLVFTTDATGVITYVSTAVQTLIGQTPQVLIGRRFTEYLPAEAAEEALAAFMALIAHDDGERVFTLPMKRADGTVFYGEVKAARFEDAGEVGTLGVIRDVTARRQAELEVQRRTEELSALYAMGRRVSASLSLEHLVAAALEEILTAVHPDVAYFFLRDGERLLLQRITPESARPLFDVPEHRVGECMCGLAVTYGKALYARDILTDLRCTWAECKAAGFRSFAAFPLSNGVEILGVIGLATTYERDFESEAAFLETLVGEVSLSFQNARLYEQLKARTAALETEIADRQRAEVSLRESETQIQNISNNLMSGMIYQVQLLPDGSRRFTYLSDAVQRLYGITAEAGMADATLIYGRVHKDDQERVFREEELAAQTMSIFKSEVRMVDPAGQIRWSYFVSSPRRLVDGTTRWDGIELDITDRKRAEAELRESEVMLRTVFENSPVGLQIYDRQGIVRQCNQVIYKMSGTTPDALIGKFNIRNDPNYQDPEVWGRLDRGEEVRTEVVFDFGRVAYETTRKGKGYFYVITTPISEAISKNIGYLMQIIDITDRRQAEMALRESEERNRLVAEMTTDYIFIVDVEPGGLLKLRWASDSMTRMTGRTIADAATSDMWASIIHPDDTRTFFGFVQQILTGASPGAIECRSFSKSGGERWIQVSAYPRVDANGVVASIVGAIKDITERKRAEEASRISLEKYRVLFEAFPLGIVVTDAQGRIIEVNKASTRILGPVREGYDQLHISAPGVRVIHPDGTPMLPSEYASIRAFREQRLIQNVETGVFKADGSLVWLNATAAPIPLAGYGVAVVYNDITARKEMEEHLRRQERLAAVGQLSAGIAHDFRNLLTTIILYAQLGLHKPGLPDGVAHGLEIIVGESRKATELVQQILDFSSQGLIERRPLEMGDFIRKVLTVLQRTIPESIRITLNVQVGEFMVAADAGRLQQVLTNLVLNARDAMPSGGQLRIGLERFVLKPGSVPPTLEMTIDPQNPQSVRPNSAWVCLSVADTGTGMTEEVRTHLFQPFFTTKGEGKGTGLGLAQVYGIIRQHDGYIGVETAVGHGTTFRLYLPVFEVATTPSTPAEHPPTLPGQGETILLVEDNLMLRTAGQSMLTALGYRVLPAVNGREALAVYRANPDIALVITDLVMPEMGGKALMESLRQIRPDVKVLAVTGYTPEEDIAELRATGFLDVIHKPFDIETLAREIRRILDEPV